MFQLPDHIRVRLGELYLRLAERLPAQKNGMIADLQRLRERQLRDAEKDSARSRKPDGVKLSVFGFRLIELFHVEKFRELRAALLDLFPAADSCHVPDRNITHWFNEFTSDLSGRRWKEVGVIARRRPHWTFTENVAIMTDLPNSVRLIEVKIDRVMPSMIALTFDVHLHSEFVNEVDEIHRRRHLSIVRFNGLLPRRRSFRSYTMTSPYSAAFTSVRGRIDGVRAEIEKCLFRKFKGYFGSQRPTARCARLPAIELYAIAGGPERGNDFHKWERGAMWWWQSIGFQSRLNVFNDEESVIYAMEEDDRDWKVVMLWPAAVSSADYSTGYSSDRAKVVAQAVQRAETLTPLVAIYSFFAQVSEKAVRLRNRVFDASPRSFREALRLQSEVQEEALLLERFALEYSRGRDPFNDELAGLSDMLRATPDMRRFFPAPLSKECVRWLVTHRSLLRSHLRLVKVAFAEKISIRNLESNYQLQRRVLALTLFTIVLSVIAALATIVGTWGAIDQQLKIWKGEWGSRGLKTKLSVPASASEE